MTRSKIVDGLLKNEVPVAELSLMPVGLDRVILSQQGVVDRKHRELAVRLWLEAEQGRPIPNKRVKPKNPGWYFRRFHTLQEAIRRNSFDVWNRSKSAAELRQTVGGELEKRRRMLVILPYLSLINLVLSRSPLWTLKRIMGKLKKSFRSRSNLYVDRGSDGIARDAKR
jgi:hypothetical protein